MSDQDDQLIDIDGDGDVDLEVGVIGDHSFVHLIPDVGPESVGIFDAEGELVAYAEDADGNREFTSDEWVAPDQASTAGPYQPDPTNVAQIDPDAAVDGAPLMPDDVDAVPGPDAVDHGPWVSPGPEEPAEVIVDPAGPDDPDERPDAEVVEDASHWFQQNTDFTCGPASATALLADLFDVRVGDESELYATAQQHGLITEGSGMNIYQLSQLIGLYGVDNQIVQYDIQQLDDRLDAGYGVLLLVDGNEYWHEGAMSDGGVGFGDANDAPHWIRVLDIDEANGVAIVSDSGIATGEGLQIPLEELDRAWGEADHFAITTEVTDDDAGSVMAATDPIPEAGVDAAVEPVPIEGIDLAGSSTTQFTREDPLGWIILPIAASGALVARLLGRARSD